MSAPHTPLPRDFYDRPTLDVARDLIGTILVRALGSGECLTGVIVETEAYLTGDPASHGFRGPTNRNRIMFGDGGHAYVYFSYGMHMMLNIVCGREGVGEAVLIRAVEPVDGVEIMRANRGGIADPYQLTNGPGKLAQAFDIDRARHNGVDLTAASSPLFVLPAERVYPIDTSARIGLNVGVDSPWRFFAHANPYVSRARPRPPRPPSPLAHPSPRGRRAGVEGSNGADPQ